MSTPTSPRRSLVPVTLTLTLSGTAMASGAFGALASCGGDVTVDSPDATAEGGGGATTGAGTNSGTTSSTSTTTGGTTTSGTTTSGGTTSGGTSEGGGDGGPRDGSSDAPASDGARVAEAGVECGEAGACTAPEVCCIGLNDGGDVVSSCMASCPSGSITATCDSKSDCANPSDHCCGIMDVGGGTFPDCPVTGGSASCSSTCPSSVPLQCNSRRTVKLCTAQAQCAGASDGYDTCCRFTSNGTTVRFCANALLSTFGDCSP